MASIKVKFRSSIVSDKEGMLYYQIIYRRVIRQLNTNYRLFWEEWNEATGFPVVTIGERTAFLLTIKKEVPMFVYNL